MRSQYNPIIIISTDKILATRGENSRNFIQFSESLKLSGIPFMRANGKYNGVTERSFIIPNTKDNLKMAIKAMHYYKQDSILVMDNESKAELIFAKHPSTVKLGSLQTTYEEPQGDYTKVLSTNQYFTFS